MAVESFREELLSCFDDFQRTLSTDTGDWTVKGFIDIYRNRNLNEYSQWRSKPQRRKRSR